MKRGVTYVRAESLRGLSVPGVGDIALLCCGSRRRQLWRSVHPLRTAARRRLHVGDHVRVAQGKKSLRKAMTHWSREIYTIEKISRVNQPWQGESYRLSIGNLVTSDRLQYVDMEKLVRIPQR